MDWYYTENGESKGPVEEAELYRLAASGRLTPSAYVWNRTLGESWIPAASVPGLFEDEAAPSAPRPAAMPGAHLPGRVSCRAPVGVAWARMKHILFQPFQFGKWFVLGFSAWLATLGESGGTSFSGNLSDLRKRNAFRAPNHFDINEVAEPLRQFWHQYGDHALLFGAALLLLGLVFALVITWLRARGKFMFLDNVLHNRAEISGPWREFTQHGNSLFWWYVLYQFACLLVFAILAGLVLLSVVLPWLRTGQFAPSLMSPLAMIGTLWVLLAVILAYIARFVEDFIIPITYRFDLTVMEAWSHFRELYRKRTGGFLLYGLFYLGLRLVAGFCVLAFAALTCCVGGCLMLIPYLGAVILLPVSVFFRAYSVEYLAQFGEEYRMFENG